MAEHEVMVSAVIAEDGSLRLELAAHAALNARSLGTVIGVLQLYWKLLDHDSARGEADAGTIGNERSQADEAESRERLDEALAGAPREQILALAKALGI